MLKDDATGREDFPPGWDSLTVTEKQILDLTKQGMSDTEIAERMFLSSRTVETHVQRILRKMEVANHVPDVEVHVPSVEDLVPSASEMARRAGSRTAHRVHPQIRRAEPGRGGGALKLPDDS